MKEYGSEVYCKELSTEECDKLTGGIWEAVAIGFGARALWEVMQNPNDFWDGFKDAFQ